ncbi:MAG: gluconate 2-dehydrogenase subunit 3 family protein, partial [Chloroflexi bacterium]|nr:gluconate 2-dehydrogenase subunit 3 family protein [Chloroflexota bacterium]
MDTEASGLTALTPPEARIVAAVFERLFPADETGPGAVEIGACTYLDRALASPYRDRVPLYRLGLAALDRAARRRGAPSGSPPGCPFADCTAEQQDALLLELEGGSLPDLPAAAQREFFELLR